MFPKLKVFGRAEYGLNLLDELDFLIDGKDSAPEGEEGARFFRRLQYVGVEIPGNFLTIGKNWSTYYKVAGFTDRFAGTGGDASGTYNAGTDGGATGTGRADSVLQTRLHFGKLPELFGIKPFNVNFQMQQGESIPLVDGAHYGTAIGLSGVYQLKSSLALGLAYNFAEIRDLDDPESAVSSLNVSEIKAMIKDGIIAGGMLPKVDACLRGMAGGVKRTHIIDGRRQHSLLLEIFSDRGIGTLIEK